VGHSASARIHPGLPKSFLASIAKSLVLSTAAAYSTLCRNHMVSAQLQYACLAHEISTYSHRNSQGITGKRI